MIRALFLAVALLASVHAVAAQDTKDYPAPFADYKLFGSIDYPAAGSTTLISRSQDFVIGGWEVECRSGLHPDGIQRNGLVAVNFNAHGQNFPPMEFRLSNGRRPDVPLWFAWFNLCPAVGEWTGYSISIPKAQLPPPGVYSMILSWRTFDGAARPAQHSITRSIAIVQ